MLTQLSLPMFNSNSNETADFRPNVSKKNTEIQITVNSDSRHPPVGQNIDPLKARDPSEALADRHASPA